MDINIRISNVMDRCKMSKIGLSENRLIRLPAETRTLYKITPGQQLTLTTKTGSLISLLVTGAHKEDVEKDDLSAYVNSEIAKLLGIEDNNSIEVSLYDGLTLGCDPEFFIVDKYKGFIHPASMFFPKWGDVGYDGIMAEIRPLPSVSAYVVTSNIFSLIKKARRIIDNHPSGIGKNIIMVASSSFNNIQAGFHLHYGMPLHMLGYAPEGSIKNKLINQIIKVMDFYIGIPSIIIEGTCDSSRRTNLFSDYGKPGGYRLDTRTLEYRVPGGALLKHPALTSGILALGAVVVEDIVSRIKEYSDQFIDLSVITTPEDIRALYNSLPQTKEIFKAICSKDTGIAEEMMSIIIPDIEKMVGYKRRAHVIKNFFSIIKHKEEFNNNIENNWEEFGNETQSGQMDIYTAQF